MSSLKGFLPTPAFVMAKKTVKNLKAEAPAESAEASAFPSSPFLFVREAGLANEGDSEKLLTKMLEAMGLKRAEVFISHEVHDLAALEKQIKMMDPKIVITLGEAAASILLGHEAPIHDLRGKVQMHRGMKVVSTYHPSFMLQNAAAKKDCWADLQLAMKEIGWKKP